jgi:hypothetical protein
MNTLHRKSVLAVFGASIFALSLIVVNPVHANNNGGLTAKFMTKNGSKLHANTRQEAKEQLATEPTVTSDGSNAEVWVYDFEPTGNSIARRRWMSN